MPKATLCVVVPAYNEAQVIGASLKALGKVVSKQHIYVVSDGSKDQTAAIARKQIPHVLCLRKNVGKARALARLIDKYELTKRYRYVLFSDADSRLSENFRHQVTSFLHTNPACIVGTVCSDKHGLISGFRVFEYGLSHRIYKRAQDIMRLVAVAPGCASVYRSDVLSQLDFSNHTLTEDFDLTIQIHKYKLGRIAYAPHAKVITQDPPTFRDYWKQIMRWNSGFWQNITLHKMYLPNRKLNFMLYLFIIDNLAWILTLWLAITMPIQFLKALGMMLLLTFTFAALIISLERQWWALKYVLAFPLFYFLNLAAYVASFFRVLFSRRRTLGWNKVTRYAVA